MYLSKGASSSREEDKALRGFCGVDLRGSELDDPSGIIIFRDQDKGQTLIPRHESWSNCACVYMREGQCIMVLQMAVFFHCLSCCHRTVMIHS